MLPDHLANRLSALAVLAEQPPNRWDGFDLRAPDDRDTGLREQIGFAGLALGVLACHHQADPGERDRARAAVAGLATRLAQRRVWAEWATAAERSGRLPDPVGEGNALFAGQLAALLSLAALLGGDPRLDEPLTLRWSSDFTFSYDGEGVAEALWRQARAHPDAAVPSAGDVARPHAMAHVLWALRLHDRARGGDYAAAGEPWLRALRERLAFRGPRLFGRGALAGSYNMRRRAASLTGDRLTDAWTLALLAPLDPELVGQIVPRHWARSRQVVERGPAVELAFDYVLAVELKKDLLAAQLHTAAEERSAQTEGADGAAFASPWVVALMAIGEAGGLGLLLRDSAARRQAAGGGGAAGGAKASGGE